MLGAFFTPSYRDWWLDYAQNPRFTSPYGGHWLVRKSAAGAFAQGLIKLDRLQPSMIEVSCVLYSFLVPKCKQTKRKPYN